MDRSSKSLNAKIGPGFRFQSYEIKSPPLTILCFRILGIFSVKNIARSDVFMFQTSDNSQFCIDSQYSSQKLTIVWSLKHQKTQPIYIFNRVRVLHLDRFKEGTWLHSFVRFRQARISESPYSMICNLDGHLMIDLSNRDSTRAKCYLMNEELRLNGAFFNIL